MHRTLPARRNFDFPEKYRLTVTVKVGKGKKVVRFDSQATAEAYIVGHLFDFPEVCPRPRKPGATKTVYVQIGAAGEEKRFVFRSALGHVGKSQQYGVPVGEDVAILFMGDSDLEFSLENDQAMQDLLVGVTTVCEIQFRASVAIVRRGVAKEFSVRAWAASTLPV